MNLFSRKKIKKISFLILNNTGAEAQKGKLHYNEGRILDTIDQKQNKTPLNTRSLKGERRNETTNG